MVKFKKIFGKIHKLQNGKRLDKALSEIFNEYSRSQIKKLILQGNVQINFETIKLPKKKVLGGEKVFLKKFKEIDFFKEAQNIPLNIIYEDNDLIIINKPYNFVVHPGYGNSNGTLLNALLYYYPKISNVNRAGIVHRLDKNTTGLMIVAKNIKSYNILVELIKKRKIIREYEAIVHGNLMHNGIINEPISRNKFKRTLMSVDKFGKEAITKYSIIKNFKFHTHLRIRLETGRTHQIRVHMKYINHPVVGDKIYGLKNLFLSKKISKKIKKTYDFNRQALHASLLRIYHPITFVKMEWRIPLPNDMNKLIKFLKNDFYLLN